MAPYQKTTVVYYDFNDVLESSTVSPSTLGDSGTDFGERSASPKPRRREWLQRQPSSYQYNLQQFDVNNYENVKHKWENKAFVVKTMPAFFGATRQHLLGKIVHRNRAKLAQTGCWDPEGLVLTEGTTPFRSKVYFAIKNDEETPKGMKVELLSGTWLSRVFVGEEKHLAKWTEQVLKSTASQRKEGNNQCFAYYPTSTKLSLPEGHTVVALFVKISDI
mmetsp:Transcript_9488/g.19722  ORF Transcript_9488/g.19722 Transcript_9488/m.19722 type:complete len:219 (+) Transcript_9488:249-905(+)